MEKSPDAVNHGVMTGFHDDARAERHRWQACASHRLPDRRFAAVVIWPPERRR